MLTTERLLIRELGPGDVDDLVALDSDPLVRRYVEDGEPVHRAAALALVEHAAGWYALPGTFGFWAAVERSTGAFLGWFHLRPVGDGAPELGYRLASSCWGRGYATEGSRALVDLAFADPAVSRVVAETMVVHTASRRVMEKAGLQLVRTFHADWPVRLPGDEHGDVEYAVTRQQWEAARRR